MRDIAGDFWEKSGDYDALVITTNGYVKKNGEAVMGRGIALQAKQRIPSFPEQLGLMLKEHGNHVFMFYFDGEFSPIEKIFVTYPVKHRWKDLADFKLIERSARELVEWVEHHNKFWGDEVIKNILLPRPGCGNGGRKWEDVKPIIEPILDDRFTVITYA